ncbi:MAG: hypothetical protein IKU54_06005 [Oscillospiraceae bacterium]|nr:hypothetical protein [Oscillospiraceae bacterium]
MNKNKYNFPRKAANSNNRIYNRYVENMYYEDEYEHPRKGDVHENTPQWKKNGRIDVYHSEEDNTDPHQSPYTVAQHYIDRTSRPY